MASSSSQPPPEERATEIINKLPSSPNIITKTGTAVLGTGLLATAISQELYVFNEETLLLVGFVVLFTYIGKVCTIASCTPDVSSSGNTNRWWFVGRPGAVP
jgi:F-type H+-transporting ATPase subunit b